MPYNFLDPQQENEYLSKAKAQGIPMGEAIAVANTFKKQQLAQFQVGLDIGKQEVEALKLQKELEALRSGKPELTAAAAEKQRFASLSRNTLQRMREIYGMGSAQNVGTSRDLSEGEGIIGKIYRVGEDVIANITGLSGKKREAQKQFIDLAQMLVGQLSQAFGSGTPQEGEAKRLIQSMPTRTSTNETALAWFQNVDRLLAQAAGEDVPFTSQGLSVDSMIAAIPGAGLGVDQLTAAAPTKPAINAYGEIAKPGDLVYNERTASWSKYGEAQENRIFKTSSEGSTIENPLIKFLADSEFLPIAGSIVGGLMGAGWASVGTSAAGAIVGKTMQQGLRELFDPERQDLSDMAKAVVTEGVTDALVGGAMFGVFKAGGKIVMSLGNAAKAGAQVAEAGIKESVKAGAKEGIFSKVIKNDIMAQFKPMKKIRAEAMTRDIDLAEAIIKGGFGDDAAANLAKTQQNLAQRGEEFRSILGSSNATIDSHKLVDDVVQDMMKSARSQSQEKAIGEWAGFLKSKKLSSADDLMTAYAQKIEAGQSGYKDAGDVVQNFIGQADAKLERKLRESILSSLDSQTRSQAENILRAQETDIFLGKMFEDAVLSDRPLSIKELIGRITNPLTFGKATVGNIAEVAVRKARSNQVFIAVGKAAEKIPESTKAVMRSIIDTLPVDEIKQPKGIFIALSDILSAKNSTLSPSMVSAVKDLPPDAQIEFLNQVIKYNAQAQNKIGMRNAIRLAFRLGVTFTANHITPEEKQEQPPMSVLQSFPSGTVSQSPGLDLGAFSPEGAPLYR